MRDLFSLVMYICTCHAYQNSAVRGKELLHIRNKWFLPDYPATLYVHVNARTYEHECVLVQSTTLRLSSPAIYFRGSRFEGAHCMAGIGIPRYGGPGSLWLYHWRERGPEEWQPSQTCITRTPQWKPTLVTHVHACKQSCMVMTHALFN